MPALSWTPAELTTLLQMQMDGRSASIIGDKIGRTRNAVLGKLHRLGLCKPASQKRDRWQADKVATLMTMIRARTPAETIAHTLGVTQSAIRSKLRREKLPSIFLSKRPRVPTIRRPAQVPRREPPSLQLTIYDLKATTCRWPQGDPREGLRYCGHPAPVERAYCDYHHNLAHWQGTYSERRATDESDKRIAA